MCTIFVAYQQHPAYRLVVAANRDEYYARPTAAAAFWPESPAVLAGRDLEAGGTWLGITTGGRFAALANHRDAAPRAGSAPSRGALVRGVLETDHPVGEHVRGVEREAHRYNGFGLLAADRSALMYVSNRAPGGATTLAPGLYGLGNHSLDTPWPKVERGKRCLREALAADDVSPEVLFEIMADGERAADRELPSTGMGPERERALSSIFVRTADYGTRSTTIVLAGYDGRVRFWERSFEPGGARRGAAAFEFALDGRGAEHGRPS